MEVSIHSYKFSMEETARYVNLADDVMMGTDTLVLNGHNCGLRVVNKALYVKQGKLLGIDREPSIYYKGTVPFKTVIILTKSGLISMESLYWLHGQGISLVMLDGIGNIVYSLLPEGESNVKLRRAQYQADITGMDGYIAREMVRQKTIAQIEYLKMLPELPRERLMPSISKRGSSLLPVPGTRVETILQLLVDGLAELPKMKDIRSMQALEGRLASHYWDAYAGLPLRWKPKDGSRVPPHWTTIGGRTSTFSGEQRYATCPFQAALNYLYGVAEHLLLRGIYAAGLDPACGFLHFDKDGRLSLVYDLIEPHRAEIDWKVYKFFTRTELRAGDVMLLPKGHIMLNMELLRYLIVSCLPDGKKLAATVTWLVDTLARGS